MRNYFIAVTITISFFYNSVYSQAIDSTNSIRNSHKWNQTQAFKTLAVPTLTIGFGLSTLGDRGFPISRQYTYRRIQSVFPLFHTHVDDFTVLVPAAAVYGLNIAGIKGKHDFVDRTMIYFLSSALTNVIVFSLKTAVHEFRPDSSTYNSFPSGHTANAFAAAEFMHQEYKGQSAWYSVAGYSVATATGIMRMLNNRHWLSDVLAGAGFGMLSTKVIYLIYPLIDRKISKGKGKAVGIIPSYYNKTLMLTFVCVIK